MTKLTKKEKFAALKDLALTADKNELAEFCDKEIAAIDKKAAKAKETAAAKKAVSDELTDSIFSVLTEDYATINDIVATINDANVTNAKVSARCSKLVAAGKAEKAKVAVPVGDAGKTREVVAYRLVVAD